MTTTKDNIKADNQLSFDNTEIAYRRLSDKELKKSYYLYKIMSYPWLVKIGSFMMTFLLKINFPVKKLIKETIFSQFCGGETLDETIPLIKSLKESNIEVLLNYSVEALDSVDSYRDTFERTMKSIQFSKEYESIRAICIKFTGFASIAIWTKLQNDEPLNQQEETIYQQAKQYIYQLCIAAVDSNVHLYIDAEESWFQDSIDIVVDEMMENFNKEQAFIFNTYQLYRNDKYDALREAHRLAREKNYILGAKIVRGAYVEKENDYANKENIISVINSSKEKTDSEYDKALAYCIENIDTISVSCATHNEASTKLFVDLMSEHNIPFNHSHVSAAQLLGMSDNITYNLTEYQINTAKYVPYGPIQEVVPYLIRRAEENTSVKGQSNRELSLIKNELNRRKMNT